MSKVTAFVFGAVALIALVVGGWMAPNGSTISNADPYALGQYYQGIGPVQLYNSTAGLRVVTPGSIIGTKKVIVVIGDSVPGNSGPTLYTVTQANNYQVNSSNGAIYPTTDPILGASNGAVAPYLSSVVGPLGDSIISGGYATNAIVVGGGMGSSVIANWAAGGPLNQNIKVIAARLAYLGLTPDAWIWHEGPNDTNIGTSQASYAASLASVIATIRTYYPTVPILVGVCSLAAGTPSAGIQAAQAAAVNNPAGIYAGVNSDAFPGGDFQDGTHFNPTGRAAWVSSAVTQLHAAGAMLNRARMADSRNAIRERRNVQPPYRRRRVRGLRKSSRRRHHRLPQRAA